MIMEKLIINYPHVRKHLHHIDFSGVNLDMFRDVSDDIELRPIEVHDILND